MRTGGASRRAKHDLLPEQANRAGDVVAGGQARADDHTRRSNLRSEAEAPSAEVESDHA
ncbi:hypothetical protein C8D03_3691 [Bosea sp. 124]|nr:hypothetical protein C8D03_3691 [Bosea sp. 124]